MESMEQQLLAIATIVINDTNSNNVELQATAVSKLIALGGDRLREQLATQFCRTHVLCEHNSLELFAEMIALVQDEMFCDQIVIQSAKLVNELLDANEEVKVHRMSTFINLVNELSSSNDWEEVEYGYSLPPQEYTPHYYVHPDSQYAMYPEPLQHFSPPLPPTFYLPGFYYIPVYFYYPLS